VGNWDFKWGVFEEFSLTFGFSLGKSQIPEPRAPPKLSKFLEIYTRDETILYAYRKWHHWMDIGEKCGGLEVGSEFGGAQRARIL